MAGLDLPVKLRRALGQGEVVPAEELARQIAQFDADSDGAVTRPELVTFLQQVHVGGPWFCEVVAKTLWTYVEQRLQKQTPTIEAATLGRIIHFVMSRGPRPERRYEITPEGMAGYKPLEPIKKAGDNATSRAAPRPGAPSVPARSQSQTPGRAPAAGAARPAAAAPRRPAPRRPGPRR